MKNLVQKILFNESFSWAAKEQILRSPLLLPCGQINAPWMGLNEAGGWEQWWAVVVAVEDVPEQLSPLFGAHARVFISRAGGRRQRWHYQQKKTKRDLCYIKVWTNCCSDKKTVQDVILSRKEKDLVKNNVPFSIYSYIVSKWEVSGVNWSHINWLTFCQAWTGLPVGEKETNYCFLPRHMLFAYKYHSYLLQVYDWKPSSCSYLQI